MIDDPSIQRVDVITSRIEIEEAIFIASPIPH